LGEIVQRAPAVGAKMWCLFVFFCHAPGPERRAFEGCIVRTSFVLYNGIVGGGKNLRFQLQSSSVLETVRHRSVLAVES